MRRPGSFDRVAWLYDPLVRLVFGRHMRESQTYFLGRIAPGSSVLVLGGGTGWILEELFARTDNCEVWFIEASEKMLKMAKARDLSGRVHFIHGSWQRLPAQKFDAIVTHYFLDLFDDRSLADVVRHVGKSMNSGGIWLVTDFTHSKAWHRAMLGAMYIFFRVLCKIEAAALPAWEETMSHAGFRPSGYKFNYGGFMKSVLFKQ